jgi:hypothetical protein
MREYEVYIQVTEVYRVEAETEEEAKILASTGQGGDAWERWDESITAEER